MPQKVSMTAMVQCAMGDAPTPLLVGDARVLAESLSSANIMDYIPMTNILPFGTCKILTAAAAGVPTPCVPAIVAPWFPGSPNVMVRGMPVLNTTSICICAIGGVVRVTSPGSVKELVP